MKDLKPKFSRSLYALSIITFFNSCENDDNGLTNELSGKWNLIDVTCECAPVDFKMGEHVWNFDLTENEVSVFNLQNEPLQILETGTYKFDLTDSTITIEDVAYDYHFEDETLFLADQPEVDGPLMEFVRDNDR